MTKISEICVICGKKIVAMKMKKAFTITELLVAISLMAVVLAASGTIFHYSVGAQRTASATSEIMHNLRAITDQLNADFEGLCKEAPVFLYYNINDNGSEEVRADRIVFFSTGDFRTTNQYNNKTVVGNVAKIFYGQSNTVSGVCPDPCSLAEEDRKEKILARRQIILTSDPSLTPSNPDPPDYDLREYKTNSLAEEISEFVIDRDQVMQDWGIRPEIDPNDEDYIPMFLARGIDDFTIQMDANDIHRIDPNGVLKWEPSNDDIGNFDKNHYPNALKFTFTLYDSKGIIKGGRTFTHIVYIGR